ncbi:DUF1365 domain-containing protein [Rhodococcus spongiicola]|uniref:DUF1365 domain-containing protein n=1 Tax=Rhodococcus spongiicola TaxID=2487352 RepID=A0A438B140_9NOCA|nr:DUF1365 domain-containing protein [Rhodococcus spongiicola]RVW04658.1 DUF1365 domain-containing protein [Rhodococcus spongiicola]
MTAPDLPAAPAIYRTTITHVRTAPLRNVFRYRSYSWFVDIDDQPRLPRPLGPLARFAPGDHLGEPSRSLRENVDAFLSAHGVDLRGGKVLLLTNARVFGYVFNPLSVFWCHDADGRLVCVIAEVHNTYGQRHCYLLRPDASGNARVDKEFYVSPFNDVDGEYRMVVPPPGSGLRVAITLERPGQPPFVATVAGERRDATTWEVLAAALAVPLAPLRVSAQIRWQGIRLWARGLPVRPRPEHRRQEAV